MLVVDQIINKSLGYLSSPSNYALHIPFKIIYITSMYNQFTAIDQKPLPMNRVQLNPMELPKGGRKKKKKLHSKNPYKIKKVKLLGEEAMAEK